MENEISSGSFLRSMRLNLPRTFRMPSKIYWGGTIKEMMESEMDEHLGYRKSERSDCDDYRNGYKTKQVNSSYWKHESRSPTGP